jgi:hypothetical protein
MRHDNRDWDFVSEKVIDGKTYAFYRCAQAPNQCFVSCDGQVKTMDSQQAKESWKEPNKIWL